MTGPGRSLSNTRIIAVSTTILAVIAVLAALELGRTVFVPIAVAGLLAAALRPAVVRLERWRLPAPLGSAALILGGLAVLVIGGSLLAAPLRDFGARIPAAVAAGLERVESLRRTLAPSIRSTRDVGDASTDAAAPRADQAPPAADSASSTGPLPPLAPIAGRLFGTTTEIAAGVVESLLLLFFLLAAGGKWHDQMIAAAPTAGARRSAIRLVGEIQEAVGRYLLVATLINVGQGVLVGIVTAVIGLPGAALWGLLTVVAEFVPYAGSAMMIVLLTLVGLTSSPSLGQALLAPAAYLGIAVVQTNLVSPILYGRGLNLNPVAILMAVVLWSFLWGVPGAFLAVPLLAAGKVLCDRSDSLRSFAAFLEA
jgi:predicted PurR-regulated permease PerM